MKNQIYIILDKNSNKYIALDRDSGGYPYQTEIHLAKFWANLVAAEEYLKLFPRENWEILQILFVTTNLD